MDFEQSVRHMNAEIGVNADQVRVKCRVVNFAQRQPVRDHRLSVLLISVHNDMSGIEQPGFGEMRDRASAAIRVQNGFSERRLMQPGLNFAKCISSFRSRR